jgi:uncharacterized protein YjiK
VFYKTDVSYVLPIVSLKNSVMITKLILLLAVIALLAWFWQCRTAQKVQTGDFLYQINTPTKTFNLPPDLEEISGICFTSDGRKLAAIQDETGYMYLIDKQSGIVEKDPIFFAEKGDFEDIAVVGDVAYIVKSKGSVTILNGIASGKPTIEQADTFLTKKDNIEGLCYDKKTNCLWFASKGQKEGDEMFKNVYSFDLNTKQLNPKPILVITLELLQTFLKKQTLERFDALKNDFLKETFLKLGPSGIAIHPKTGEIYIISSINKVLMVFNRQNELLTMVKMDKTIHRQPEGICFDTDGTLYISNEAKGEVAQLHVFMVKNAQ